MKRKAPGTVICQATQKVTYHSSFKAGKMRDNLSRHKTLDVYRCPFCHQYHLGNRYS